MTQRLRTDDRARLPVRLHARADGTYYARPLLPRRQLRPLRLPQRERTSPQRRARPVAARPVRDRRARPHARRRRAAQRRAEPLQRRSLQLRRHRQRRRHRRRAARARPGRRQHRPRRAHDRALPARRHRDRAAHAPLWLGARHTRLDRGAVGTDGTQADPLSRSRSPTPFAAAELRARGRQIVYASWGRRRANRDVAPTCRCTSTHGQALPAAKSRQTELGLKGGRDALRLERSRSFDIRRPLFGDLGTCDGTRCQLHARPASAPSATAASRPRTAGAPARGSCAAARSGCTHASKARPTPRSTASARPTCPR